MKTRKIDENQGRLSESELILAREKRQREIVFWKLVKHVGSQCIFVSVLFLLSYSGLSSNAFKYKQSLEKLFFDDSSSFWKESIS